MSGFADNDAGGITTYSVVGAKFGYVMLWVVLASMLALFFTQEAGARLGLATGRGLLDLIRENFGIRWAALAIGTMLVANLGTTIAEFAGIGAALSLFGVPVPVADAAAVAAVGLLLARGGFLRIQYVFLAIGAGVSVAYAVSAVLAHPDWGTSARVPGRPARAADRRLPARGGRDGGDDDHALGAGVHPVVLRRQAPRAGGSPRRPASMSASASFLTNTIAAFIVIAAAATLWAHGHTTIPDAAAAAKALGPLAGHSAETVFALGLLGAAFLGLGVVPLTSAYCDDRGARPGARTRPSPPPGAGVLRAARVLPRRRGRPRPDPGPAADPA